jgi:hypothetical protein
VYAEFFFDSGFNGGAVEGFGAGDRLVEPGGEVLDIVLAIGLLDHGHLRPVRTIPHIIRQSVCQEINEYRTGFILSNNCLCPSVPAL